MKVPALFLSVVGFAGGLFASSAETVGPETWFHVIGGNATAEGLTKDLEAIKSAGISGIQFFHGKFAGGKADVWEGMENNQTPCLSPNWDKLVTHVADECRRLGLSFKMQNCPGWSMAGGPWITPDKAQRALVWSRTDLDSDGSAVEQKLAATPCSSEPWRDVKPIAVVAFPTPKDDIAGYVRPDRVADPFFAPAFEGRAVPLDPATRDDPHVIAFSFDRPTSIRTVELPAPSDFGQDWPCAIGMHVTVEAETASGTWTVLCDREMPNGNWQDGAWADGGEQSFAVSDACAKNWRIRIAAEHAGPLAYIRLRPGARLDNWESLAFLTLRNIVREKPQLRQDASAWVKRTDIVDLSDRVDAQGVFRGTLPKGKWTVLRFADVNAGRRNGPAPEEATGWECDKLDPKGIEANFAGYIGRLADGPLKGKLDGMLLDSWECARPNWTGKMERLFGERNGYPLRTWMPALAGFVLDDPATTERFLLDWRTTVATLIEENFFRRAAELGHEKGLSVQYETAFGDVMPGDLLRYWKWADEPMCEFWQPHENRGFVGDLRMKPVRPCASAAHVYGKRRVSAEALTSFVLSWNENFRDFRHATVRHLLRGVTHLVFHTYTHNPLADRNRPGTSFGGAIGSPFLRGQTWWKWMPDFTGFLARCGRLLESGVIANEALQYIGDDLDGRPDELPQTLAGFGFDLLNRDALLERFSVRDGRFVTPDGASWKVLWVPSGLYLRDDTTAKLAELEKAGGRIVRGTLAEFAAATADIRRDVVGEVDFIHRRDGGKDVFFVSGKDGAAFCGDVRFDMRGPVRVYDPVADRSWTPRVRAADGGTAVPLALARDEAVFVVFNDGTAEPRREFADDGRELKDWMIAFPRGNGCPKSLSVRALKPLKDLDAPEEVAGFAGDVSYRTTFEAKAGEPLRLSLGKVEAWAEVRVNGRTAARLWCAPYACDITDFVRDGANELEVVVTTTWLNRLVLDARGNGHSLGSWVKAGPNQGHPYVDSGLIGPVRLESGALVPYVDPFIGTQGTGHTTPAAAYPFGFLQPGPDTGWDDWAHCSGYQFADTNLLGFSQTHLSGTGCPDLGDMRLVPMTGEARRERYALRMDKASERASAGYYAVRLPDEGLLVEMTVAPKAAMYRITPEKDGVVHLFVDQEGRIGDFSGWRPVTMPEGFIREDGDRAFDASFVRNGWVANRKVCSRFEFSHPFAVAFDLPCVDGKNGVARRVLDFNLKKGEPLVVRLALSASSTAAAKRNLDRDLSGKTFDEVRAGTVAAWERTLSRVRVEGTDAQKTAFYTSLYHAFFQPNEISDYGDPPFYSTLSCWDTFRALHPLYTVICPEKAAEIVDSALEQGRRTGYLPIWTLWGLDNQCMIGTHSIPVIVDAWLKGVWPQSNNPNNRTIEQCYQQIKETLTKRHEGREKENWDLYDKYGYYPFDLIKGESASRTMECAYDDWCAAQMAEKLGHKEDAAFFLKRAAYWKNVFDPSLGLVRGRDSKGNWREPYDPYALGHGAGSGNDFTEGNAFQYSWHVMQDVPGLVAAMGGKEKFVKKLDALFEAPSKTEGMGEVLDVTGLIGQYVHGNEPSHHVIYFYPQVGHPEKAAERIREVFDRFYRNVPDGLCGNDDCGQMSAWYVFSAMGFYPFNPCGGEYVIGAPQFEKVTLHCRPTPSTYTSFTVVAKNLSKENKYVKSVTLNGKPLKDFIIRHEQIMSGGELVFEF